MTKAYIEPDTKRAEECSHSSAPIPRGETDRLDPKILLLPAPHSGEYQNTRA